ncbi:MAG TPA: DUF6064 family protein [Burkholderiaceae bacterium]|nr:DUF6064 family protein [Burkholderiaceae bacterium]
MIGDGWQVWSTYRPSDLLLFSARTYRRLFELYNADHRAVNLLLAAGVTVLLLFVAALHRRAPAPRRTLSIDALATAGLALAWAWIAWAFHLQRYATINWIAPAFAAAFALQALLLAGRSWRLWRGTPPDNGHAMVPARRRFASLLLLALAILYPLIGLLMDRPPGQSELVGTAPDPTAIATLAMMLRVPASRWPWVIPLAWLALSSGTLLLLDAADALVPVTAAVLAIAGAWRTGRQSGWGGAA